MIVEPAPDSKVEDMNNLQTRILKISLAFLAIASLAIAQPNTPDPARINDTLTICSFNIQFLGSSKKRDNAAISDILKSYDIVMIDELVAPPVNGQYPDGRTYIADPESKAFFDAMAPNGFSYAMSPEETGPGKKKHPGGTAAEWWVAFYKPATCEIAPDLPTGFISKKLCKNLDYQRVPFAFGFRTPDSSMDFVLIPVHLQPGKGTKNKDRRKHELGSIAAWIDSHDSIEKDFFILGDMNVYSAAELEYVTPAGFESLNDECRPTTTNVTGPDGGKPYDQVMYRPSSTSYLVDSVFDLQVINLVDVMKSKWKYTSKRYPGKPYKHNAFRAYFSDHDPVVYRLIAGHKRG